MTVQIKTQGQGTGDLLRPIRLNAAARGVVKDSGGGGGGVPLCTGLRSRATQSKDEIRMRAQYIDSEGRL